MEQRISIITLGVKDLKTAAQFYADLGWKTASDENEGIIAYNLHAQSLCLYPHDKLAEDIGIPAAEKPTTGGITLAYNVDEKSDVQKVLNAAEKAGGKIIKQAQDVFWGGHSGYFADLDGHLWEVAYNPFSPLGPNGEFQWGGYNN